MENIQVGTHFIRKTAALAPMASVADRAYRLLCKRYGASLVVGEMASAKGLCYSDRKTAELLEVTAEEYPMAIQLFGSEPEFMSKACKIAARYEPQFIDINMGCPVHKVTATGAGSALLKTPEVACSLVRACVEATDIPVTVKIRTGWDANSVNAVEMAQMLEEAGASAIAVHGRTKQQMYAPSADWSIIAKVKQAVHVPVFGNGDVTTPQEAKAMYEQTGCDLVMIGRGSYGHPWIFEEVEAYLERGELLPPKPLEERMEIMLEHAALICSLKGERIAMREARKHAAWYLKGVKQAAKFRNDCGQLETYEDIRELARMVLEANAENL
jgi:tRNA-dihydrouridine synthase B